MTDCTNTLNLSQAQVNSMFGVKSGVGLTRLPDHLSYPDHWHTAEDSPEDSLNAEQVYKRAWMDWKSSKGVGE
ncbi:MAG: hypothetical protein ABJG55_03885 [Paracoccaceae bacterium]